MSVFICCLFPKKSAVEKHGVVSLAIAIEANSAKMAAAMANVQLMHDYPESEHYYFAPKVCADRVGIPRPALGKFDESFLTKNQWNDDLKEVEAIPFESDEILEESFETENDGSQTVNYWELSAELKYAALIIFGTPEITKHELQSARTEIMADESSFENHISEALSRVTCIAEMYPERVLELIQAIRNKFRADTTWPAIKDFVVRWTGTHPNEREVVTSNNKSPAEKSQVNDRGIEHNIEILKLEIACALFPGDFNIYEIPGSIMRRAKEMIQLKEKKWVSWSAVLCNTTGILNFSRKAIFELIRNAPDDLHMKHRGEMQSYINVNLTEPVVQPSTIELKNLGGGKFSIDELVSEVNEQPIPQSIKEPDEVPKQDESENSEPAIVQQPMQHSSDDEKTVITTEQPSPNNFQSIGAALESDLAEKGDNMKIWRSVMRTDPRYTKDLAGAGFEGTSINAEYMFMRATEIFGPIGTGWGFEVMEDRMLPGAPMSEAIYEDKKFIGNRLLRDGDGTLITEKNHSIKIKFWYAIEGEIRGEIEAFGATKYLYKTKNRITCDGEAQKKSLTDAIKKALSLLGFSADVWLGLYDQAEYKQENATEFAIKNASEKAEDVSRLRNELDEKLTRVANTIENAVSPNEAKKVFDTLAREVEVHRKAAEAKGDNEHAKYLSGRLRRLSQIKEQRIQTLADAEASNA